MTSRPLYNQAAFRRAADRWRTEFGHDVVTPFDANSAVWQRHHGRDFDPATDVCDWGDPILPEMIAEDFRVLCMADALALLPEWEKSKGSRAELLVALNLGKPVFDAETGERMAVAAAVTVTPTDETILQEAQRLVHGDRGADYGHPIDDYTRTGRMWGAILGLPDIDPRVCCLMMAAMKVSRECNKAKRDNLTDLAGYAECASMVAERQAGR